MGIMDHESSTSTIYSFCSFYMRVLGGFSCTRAYIMSVYVFAAISVNCGARCRVVETYLLFQGKCYNCSMLFAISNCF